MAGAGSTAGFVPGAGAVFSAGADAATGGAAWTRVATGVATGTTGTSAAGGARQLGAFLGAAVHVETPYEKEQEEGDGGKGDGQDQADAVSDHHLGVDRPQRKVFGGGGRRLLLRRFGALQGVVDEAHAARHPSSSRTARLMSR